MEPPDGDALLSDLEGKLGTELRSFRDEEAGCQILLWENKPEPGLFTAVTFGLCRNEYDGRRQELMAIVDRKDAALTLTSTVAESLAQARKAIAAGETHPFDGVKDAPVEGVVAVASELLPPAQGVDFVWLLPIKRSELALVADPSHGGKPLLEGLRKAGHSPYRLDRPAVA